MTQAAVGWADLLQVLDALPEGRWNEAADALGFQPREDGQRPPLPIPPVERPPEPAPPPVQPEPVQVQAAAEERQVFWRVASDLPDPEAITEAPAWFTRTDLPDASVFQSAPDVAAPSRRPLARPAQLAAFFRRHLAFERPSAEPDLRRLLRHIVRQQPLRRWPLRLRRRWPARVHLVYDRSPALQPLHDDLAPIARQLHRLLGPRLNLLLAEGSPSSLCDADEMPTRLPTDGASVVLLGDAGLLSAGSEAAQTWSGWSARRESTGRRPLVLAPLPRARVDALLSRHADVCPLDAPGSLRLSTARPFGRSPVGQDCTLLRAALFGNSFVTPALLRDLRLALQRAGHPLDVATEAALWRDPAVGASSVACTLLPAQREAAARDFRQWPAELREAIASVHWLHLQSASPLVRAEYVRWLRPELPDTSALADEFDQALRDAEQLMQQACLAMHQDPQGLGCDLAAYVSRLGHRSQELVERGEDALQAAWMLANRDAWQSGQLKPPPGVRQDRLAWLLKDLPERGAPQVLCVEGYAAGGPPMRPTQRLVLKNVDRLGTQAVLLPLGRVTRAELTPISAPWSETFRPLVERVAAEVAQWSSVKLAATVAALAVFAEADPDGPVDELRTVFANALTNAEARRAFSQRLMTWGSKWLLSHTVPAWTERLSAKIRRALLAAVRAPVLEAFFAALDRWQEAPKPNELRPDEPCPLENGRAYEVNIGSRRWKIEPFHRPKWAKSVTCELGLWTAEAPGGRTLVWIPRRRYRLAAQFDDATRWISRGAWWDTRQAAEFPLIDGEAVYVFPTWAHRHGLDEYGPWAEFDIRGTSGLVTQRLRWIPPGEFLMGSPEAEAERKGDGEYAENLHCVVLSQGFWLADTACTQALWEAVLGENPSRFKDDPANPVEQVSWNAVKENFLPALNRLVPGLEAVLPSESQWEYACRAGTQTPFWFGEQITTEQVNYGGIFSYAGGAKGEYRRRTVPVKGLPANGWGLYEMHGNVYEWCEDVMGQYPNEPVVDPVGPREGLEGRQRVLRGGSWNNGGGYCRSADRFAYGQGERGAIVGFRLARGLGVPPPANVPNKADPSMQAIRTHIARSMEILEGETRKLANPGSGSKGRGGRSARNK